MGNHKHGPVLCFLGDETVRRHQHFFFSFVTFEDLLVPLDSDLADLKLRFDLDLPFVREHPLHFICIALEELGGRSSEHERAVFVRQMVNSIELTGHPGDGIQVHVPVCFIDDDTRAVFDQLSGNFLRDGDAVVVLKQISNLVLELIKVNLIAHEDHHFLVGLLLAHGPCSACDNEALALTSVDVHEDSWRLAVDGHGRAKGLVLAAVVLLAFVKLDHFVLDFQNLVVLSAKLILLGQE